MLLARIDLRCSSCGCLGESEEAVRPQARVLGALVGSLVSECLACGADDVVVQAAWIEVDGRELEVTAGGRLLDEGGEPARLPRASALMGRAA